jgi:signal transduction histidine kinase
MILSKSEGLSPTQAVPIVMAVIGITFTLFENLQHRDDPLWPWPTLAGIIVLGIISPSVAWIVLRWAFTVANAYLVSQEQLSHRLEELSSLNQLSVASTRSLDLEKNLVSILEHTMEALEAAAGMIFVQEDHDMGLRLEVHRGISVDMAKKESRLAPGHCLCGQAVETRQVLFAGDVGLDPRCTSDLCICEGFRSVACAPLEVKGQLVGLIQIASPNFNHFNNDQRDFLSAVAAQVSVSVENSRLYDQLQTFNIELEKKVRQRTSELEATRWSVSEKARQLQRLLSESYRIQEDTQARIAQDMHDSVTQMIIGALYETQAARQALGEDSGQSAVHLANAQNLLSEVETEIRQVIYDLHPPVLDMMGVVVALKRFAITYSAAFNIECKVQLFGVSHRLSKDTEIGIYRIVQAALNNVASHAKAEKVRVAFHYIENYLRVIIEDDGVGFDPDSVFTIPGEHLGLIGMKERAEGIGAELDISSELGSGTRIELLLDSPVYVEMD